MVDLTTTIELSKNLYTELIVGQASGKVITTQGGVPVLTDPVPVQPPKPTSVTMRQARLALLQTGHLSAIQAAIGAISDSTERQAAQIEWEFAATVDRSSSFTQSMVVALGLTEESTDNLFTLAASL